MKVVLYAVRVKGGCVLWVRYPEDGTDVTEIQRKNAVILTRKRNIPDTDPDKLRYKAFVAEMIELIRSKGLNLLNARDFEDKPVEREPELETA